MSNKTKFLRRKSFLAVSLSVLLLSICSYHYLARIDINITVLIIVSALVVLMCLADEGKSFVFSVAKNPKKHFLPLCILVSSAGGLIINLTNLVETGLFLALFLSTYAIYSKQDSYEINFTIKLIIYSGVFMSFGVLMGLFESVFLSSKLFYHVSNGYPYFLSQKHIYSGFGFNQNYSAYIIIVALSFLFSSEFNVSRKLRNYLALLFILALLITGARIVFLFFSLIAVNYFFKKSVNKCLISLIFIVLYLLFTHIIVGLHGNYELGSSHYRELLFSIGNIDFILGNYGYMKLAYFAELRENLFFPVNLKEVTQSIGADPHSLFYSLIILGGPPLLLSIVVFLTLGILKNLTFIEQNYSKFYYCGLISIITETLVWDATNSIFFWFIIIYAITISKDAVKHQTIS
jgi:hypothetical protein